MIPTRGRACRKGSATQKAGVHTCDADAQVGSLHQTDRSQAVETLFFLPATKNQRARNDMGHHGSSSRTYGVFVKKCPCLIQFSPRGAWSQWNFRGHHLPRVLFGCALTGTHSRRKTASIGCYNIGRADMYCIYNILHTLYSLAQRTCK